MACVPQATYVFKEICRHRAASVTADAICYDTSDSQRKCDMTMLVYIIVVSRRMNCVGRQFHLVENVFLRSLDALHDVDMSHTSDSPRKCDMTMLVYIIVVSRF